MTDFHHIAVADDGGTLVATVLPKRLCDVATTTELESEWLSLAKTMPHETLTLDLSAVEFMASQGLGKLIALNKHLRDRKCSLVLRGVRPPVYAVLTVTHLDKFFTIVRELEE